MARLIEDMCRAYVEKWAARVENYGATHLLHPGDPIQPSEDPMLDERGYFVDEEFEGLCRKMAQIMVGSHVKHRSTHRRFVLVVTRVLNKPDCAMVTAIGVNDRSLKITDRGCNFEVIGESG